MIRHTFIFITLLLSLSLSSNDVVEQHWVKKHTCDKQKCPEGRCHFENCENPTSCDGGLCVFVNCNKPSCSGGLCTFTECTHPRCGGGKCEFQDTKVCVFSFLRSSIITFQQQQQKNTRSRPSQTTLMHGFCSGGYCMVDNEVVESNMQDQLAY